MTDTVNGWIRNVLAHKDLTRMGRAQRCGTASFGLGWLYYGMTRAVQPAMAVVIGSDGGFVPLVLGRALADNGGGTETLFP
jgi:hypothetical protein